MSKTILIMGSSNPKGDTNKISKSLIAKYQFKYQDLGELVIMPFDYSHDNRDDDFLGFMRHLLKSYDTLIFATPVYWYSMSGIMKNFLDRFSDLLKIEKEMGRSLRGKNFFAFSVSASDDCPEEFPMPFQRSAEYLGMNWKGYCHFPVEDQEKCAQRIELVGNLLGI